MKTKHFMAAAALVALFSQHAFASVITVPVNGAASGAFSQQYTFNVSGLATVVGDTDSGGISWFGVMLQSIQASYTALDPNPDDGFSFAGLSAGSYTLTFLGSGRGEYQGSFTVTTFDNPQVPEPSAFFLLLAGLGVLGWGALRRRSLSAQLRAQ